MENRVAICFLRNAGANPHESNWTPRVKCVDH